MAASAKEVAVADQYVAAKLAFKKNPTKANEAKFEKLRAELIAVRNEERAGRGGFSVTGSED